MVYPRLNAGGVFVAHNVVNKKNEMEPFLADHPHPPGALHDDRVAVGRRHVGVVQDPMTTPDSKSNAPIAS